ncbi:MAG: type I restriction enzyme HsdR N-terminal domain-containing protein [Rhodothermales bacterium]
MRMDDFSALPELDLPAIEVQVQHADGKALILDPIRRKFVRLTPEEWVRQHWLQYLTVELGYPKGLLAVEKSFRYAGALQRADVVAHDARGTALLALECKAPEVAITQAVWDQAARYNTVLMAQLLVVSNGFTHFVCHIDHAAQTVKFLDAIPTYAAAMHL